MAALTELEMAKIRMYLGWSDRFHQTDSRLEMAFQGVREREDTLTLIRADVARCDAALAAIDATDTTSKAVAAGPIQLRVHYQISALLKRGELAAGRIATLLGVAFRTNIWQAGGPAGFAGPGGLEE